MNGSFRKSVRILGTCLFVLYMVGLVYFLFLSENFGHGGAGEYDYNIIPFREIIRYVRYRNVLGMQAVLTNLLGNVIGFMPLGALVPLMARSARKVWRTTLLSFEISVLVEVSQLVFHVGCFDVDDMILNTIGGLLGYLLFWGLDRLYLRIEAKRMRERTAAAQTGTRAGGKRG
ncbi:MAG: VanZ family protein [Clostridiales bacterium]|nr:VanZ family protein [Clostridiales bacterium]